MAIYINGYIPGSSYQSLLSSITKNGGRIMLKITGETTHIISYAQIQSAKLHKLQDSGKIIILSPEYFLRCIEEKKRLPVSGFSWKQVKV